MYINILRINIVEVSEVTAGRNTKGFKLAVIGFVGGGSLLIVIKILRRIIARLNKFNKEKLLYKIFFYNTRL